MAENHSSSKRKYDDPSPPPRRMGFSPGTPGALPAAGGPPAPSSYNSLRPLPDEIQLAKRRGQEIADGEAEAKRPRVVNAADECSRGCGADLSFSSPAADVFFRKSAETWENHQVNPRAKIQVNIQPIARTRSVELSDTTDQIKRAEELADFDSSGTLFDKKHEAFQPAAEQLRIQIANNKQQQQQSGTAAPADATGYSIGTRQPPNTYAPTGSQPIGANQLQQLQQQQSAPGIHAPANPTSYNTLTSQPPNTYGQYSIWLESQYAAYDYGTSGYRDNNRQTPIVYPSYLSGGQTYALLTNVPALPSYLNQGLHLYNIWLDSQRAAHYYGTSGMETSSNPIQHGSSPSYGGPSGATQTYPGPQTSIPASGSQPYYYSQPPQVTLYGQAPPPGSAQAGFGHHGYSQAVCGAPLPYSGAPPWSQLICDQQKSHTYPSGGAGAYSTEATAPPFQSQPTLTPDHERALEDEVGPDGKKMHAFNPSTITKIEQCGDMLIAQRKKRKVPPSLVPVDALKRYTQISCHPLHMSSQPGILSIDIHCSKDIIATGGADSNAVIFDRPSEKMLCTLTGHSKKVTSLKFAPRDELLITGSADKTVRIWHKSQDGNYGCRHILKDHAAEVQAVTVHPTKEYFVTASRDNSWCFYDISTGSCLTQVGEASRQEGYTSAAFHPDGLHLGTGTSEAVVRIWDVRSQSRLANLDGHVGPVTAMSFSENGYFLATLDLDAVRLWDLRKLSSFRTYSPYDPDTPTCVEFDLSGRYLAVAGSDIRVCKVAKANAEWNLIKALLPDFSGLGKVTSLKFGTDAKYIAVGSQDSNLRILGIPGIRHV